MKYYQPQGEIVHLTDENIHKQPALIQEVYHDLKNKKTHELLTPKYYDTQKLLFEIKLNEIYKEAPHTLVKDVVIQILTTLPDFIPPDKVFELTQFIFETWIKLQRQKAIAA